MDIHKATRDYEAWALKQTKILKDDLALKHQRMGESPFAFFRATFYRWAELWPMECAGLAKAPVVLAVGDLHVENFGTWRDADSRLAWGVNDFDEVHPLPYTFDLVRLATSARLAVEEHNLGMTARECAEALLAGYQESLEGGGKPFVLEEKHPVLREAAMGELRDPPRFWEKMDKLPEVKGAIPAEAREALETMLPEKDLSYRVAHRTAGLGSLGRERYVALAEWRGGKVAREAKALFESAVVWASGSPGNGKILYQEMLDRAVRDHDPFVRLCGRWIVRRLAPHCSRIELAAMPKARDEARLLHAMGFETANVHWARPKAIPDVLSDLKKRPAGWLHEAAKLMAKSVEKDWDDWRKGEG
jgi:Uncharacterized protein conserved in bacteria (DUF2252)